MDNAIVTTTQTAPAGLSIPSHDEQAFALAQRQAKLLAASELMPAAYRSNIPNCVVALELANRIGASPLMVAQNLDVIHGRPSWRASFLIATVNASKRFSPLRYRFTGSQASGDEWGCRAVAADRESGEECVGPLITIGLARAEGWASKSGSKWKTMPELMLMYRAAAFWSRVYAPELSLGIQTAEESEDIGAGFAVAAGTSVHAAALAAPKHAALEALDAADLDPPKAEEPAPEPAAAPAPKAAPVVDEAVTAAAKARYQAEQDRRAASARKAPQATTEHTNVMGFDGEPDARGDFE